MYCKSPYDLFRIIFQTQKMENKLQKLSFVDQNRSDSIARQEGGRKLRNGISVLLII